ncbi:MAG: SwmB domain-containing protein, partial [bacterium]|nr:SwmB domain-containing protein [bacterium]
MGSEAGADNVPAVPDRSAPSVARAAVDRTVLSVTFDEDLDTGSAPAGSAFTVTARPPGGLSRTIEGTSAAVTINGATVTATLASAVAAGETVTVRYAKPASSPLQDADGNDVESFSGQTVANDTDGTPPRLVSAAVNGVTAVLTFDEPLDESVTFLTSQFYRFVSGDLGAKHSTGASVSGRTVTVTFAAGDAVRHGQQVFVWYNKSSNAAQQIKDRFGNAIDGTPLEIGWTVTNNTPPAFSSAAVNGATLTITFDGALDESSVPAAGAFAVKATRSGTERSVALADTNPVAVDGAVVTLTLAEAVLAAAI